MATGAQPPSPAEPTIHNAERASDGSGAVEWWNELDEHQAIARRRLDLDIVVRGPDKRMNREKAKEIEAAVGAWKFHVWHAIGSLSLPHFQQDKPPPNGHSFYEVDNRKARKKP